MTKNNSRLTISKEEGLYNPKEWIDEAEIHKTSSSLLRELGGVKEEELKDLLKNSGKTENEEVFCIEMEKRASYKSSILLIGYAIELILKSAVIHFYRGLPKSLVDRELKKYGHKLENMTIDLGISVDKTEKELLGELKTFIVSDARYPIVPEDKNHENHYNKWWKKINCKLQNNEYYDNIERLYNKIYSWGKKVDNDKSKPSTVFSLNIDQEGYLVYRFGGNLPDRATVKYSSLQISSNENNIKSLKTLIEKNSSFAELLRLAQNGIKYNSLSMKQMMN